MSRHDSSCNYQYISNLPGRDGIYVEGSYNPEFKDFLKYNCKGQWDGERWKVDKKYLSHVKQIAKQVFSKVYYTEGGDYDTI